MKNLVRTSAFLGLCFLLIACSRAIETTPTSMPLSSAAAPPTRTAIPSQSATITIEAPPTQAYIRPTLIPTIELTLIPDLLKNAFLIQTHEGANGHDLHQIMGWGYGFREYPWPGICSGFHWLDAHHLLIYPAVGQRESIGGAGVDVATQAVVINLESGHVWLPRSYATDSYFGCLKTYWSRELGILITSGGDIPQYGPSDDKDTVFTYTFDGQIVDRYWGKLLDVSPSGTKILVDDDTTIDLRTKEITEFAWYMDYDQEGSSKLFWTSDENRVYRCCYYFGDTVTGKSYRFDTSELRGIDGKPAPSITFHTYGQWVRNDDYFMMEWSWIDDGDKRFLPMFDPNKKIYYEVREMAGIPDDYQCMETTVSPDGIYVWLAGGGKSFLVNLVTFDTVEYPISYSPSFYWSADSKFAWLGVSGVTGNDPSQYYVLSVSDKELKLISINSSHSSNLEWHPTDNVLTYISEDGQKLGFLNAQTMSIQELELPSTFRNFEWSPSGKYIALIAEDDGLWQVDYPNLENLEQIAPSLHGKEEVRWSPDGEFIAFISGSDIFIVDTVK